MSSRASPCSSSQSASKRSRRSSACRPLLWLRRSRRRAAQEATQAEPAPGGDGASQAGDPEAGGEAQVGQDDKQADDPTTEQSADDTSNKED